MPSDWNVALTNCRKGKPLGRSKAGVSLVANIILSKYVEHTPLHRLIQRFARSDLQIPPTTMGQWTKNGIDFLLLLYQLYEKLIFGASYLQMDETTFIKPLYQVEENAKNLQLNADQRLELRLKESKPIFDALGEWLQTNYNLVTPASPIGKAIAYALHRWENMKVFLTDGRIEIDNNLVENAIRPAAIGRKNYLFAGSHESAQRTAMIYTFFSACKQYQIDPEIWLNDVLNQIQDCKISELELLLPQFWKPKEEGIG